MRSLIAVLVLAAAALGAATGTATAATWHADGSGSFTAQTPAGTTPTFRLPGGSSVGCGGPMAGTFTLSSGPPPNYSWAGSMGPILQRYSSCRAAIIGVSVGCTSGSAAYTSYNAGVDTTLAGAPSKLSTGSMTVSCTISLGATACGTISGSVPVVYANPPTSTLTVAATGQSLVFSTVGGGCSGLLGGGAATLTTSLGGALSLGLTSAYTPTLWHGT